MRGASRSAATAAESTESFYGLLARESLGLSTKLADDPFVGNDPPVDGLVNVQRAMELTKIGEPALAEELLRHQAKIGAPSERPTMAFSCSFSAFFRTILIRISAGETVIQRAPLSP